MINTRADEWVSTAVLLSLALVLELSLRTHLKSLALALKVESLALTLKVESLLALILNIFY